MSAVVEEQHTIDLVSTARDRHRRLDASSVDDVIRGLSPRRLATQVEDVDAHTLPRWWRHVEGPVGLVDVPDDARR